STTNQLAIGVEAAAESDRSEFEMSGEGVNEIASQISTPDLTVTIADHSGPNSKQRHRPGQFHLRDHSAADSPRRLRLLHIGERVDDVLARQTLGVPMTEDHSQVLKKLHRTTIGFGHGVREFQCCPASPFRPVPSNRFGNGKQGTPEILSTVVQWFRY